jgi:hypothetical protein
MGPGHRKMPLYLLLTGWSHKPFACFYLALYFHDLSPSYFLPSSKKA